MCTTEISIIFVLQIFWILWSCVFAYIMSNWDMMIESIDMSIWGEIQFEIIQDDCWIKLSSEIIIETLIVCLSK